MQCERHGNKSYILFFIVKGNFKPLLSPQTYLKQGFIWYLVEDVNILTNNELTTEKLIV